MHEGQSSLCSVTWAGGGQGGEGMGFKCRCRLEMSLQLQLWTAGEMRTKQHPLAQQARDKGDRRDSRDRERQAETAEIGRG